MTKIYDDYVNKIEGHGTLHIDFKHKTAHFEVSEGERLFEGLVIDKKIEEVPFIVSRICGICPTAHYLCSIKALENALNIEPSHSTILLRKLMLSAQIIQSHNLHLFFLALPDFLKLNKNEIFAEKYPDEFHICLNIKKIADKILEKIGGRSIHPITPVVGGFSKKIANEELTELRFELENILDDAEYVVDLFSELIYPQFSNPTTYLALSSNDEYEIYDGNVKSNKAKFFKPEKYQEHIKEKIFDNSRAKVAYLKRTPIMVGPLARLFLNSDKLSIRAQAKLETSPIDIKSFNPFYNNFAQSIEILHFVENSIKIIDKLIDRKIDTAPNPYKIKAANGVAAVEAPRGTLYHSYEFDSSGRIQNADILTPTGQNLSNLENDAQKLIRTPKGNKTEKENLIEKLIRAYDPCLTCSVH